MKAQATNSAENSRSSDTAVTDPVPVPTPTPTARAPDDVQKIINSCAAAAIDLEKTRELAKALETENGLLKTRLDTEKRTSGVLLELNETRKLETASLRETIAAKNETIAAKDSVIESQDKLIAALKKKKSSPLKRIQDVLIGVALLALFR